MEARERGERAWGTVALGALVFLCALPYLYVRSRHLREWEDEGYFANGALRLLDGEVVYRDFQHNYPPGRATLIAALVAVFGHHLWVVRALWVVLQALAAAIGFAVARRLMPLGFALLAAATIVMNTAWMNKSAELFLSAAILWILVRLVEGRLPAIAAGAMLAGCGMLRHDVAAFGVIVALVALGLRTWIRRREGEHVEPGPFGSAVVGGLWMYLGATIATLPLLVYLVVNDAVRIAVRDLLFSGYIANKLLPRPFPPLGEALSLQGTAVLFWIPVATYAAGLVLAAGRLRRPETRTVGASLLVVVLYGGLVFLQVLPRSDMGHLNKAYVPVHVVGALLVAAGWGAVARAAGARRFVTAGVALVLTTLAAAMPLLHAWRLGVELPNSTPSLLVQRDRYVDVELPRGTLRMLRGPALKYQPLFDEIAPYAGRDGEWLVVYPAGALLNFVFDLPNPLRYDLLRPGEMAGQHLPGDLVANHPEVLRELMERLAETRPRFLMDSSENTNEEVRALISGYAAANGYRELVGGRFRLWVRPE